jgi:tRNA dimethylallyltransferase
MENSLPLESAAFAPLSRDATILTGATASGKSQVAITLAEKINAEIISLDSIAVYQGMDIGTAKPPLSDRTRVRHHLIDVVEPSDDFSTAEYLRRVTESTEDLRRRGKRPLFVGGTPLYLKALMYGFDPGPPADWEFRRSVEEDVQVHGIDALHRRLQQVDPLSAHRLPPTDVRRITRALEVVYLTGVPLSHRQNQFERIPGRTAVNAFAIAWPRETLHKRIESRVNKMFVRGLVDEVQGLVQKYGRLSRTASAAVGYREVIGHLEQNNPLESVIDSVICHTRKLARHQETWFRSLPTLRVMQVEQESDLDQIVSHIEQAIE